MEIQQLLSKYMLEISKVTNEETLYSALSGILKRVIEINSLNVIRSNEIIYSEPLNVYIEKEAFSDYISWVEERLYPTFLPLEEGYIGLIPIFKAKNLLATIVIKTPNEPTAEVMDYVQLLAYLSGITLENLRLLDFVDKAREYFESIINLSNDGIIVLNENDEPEFVNNKAREIINIFPSIIDTILRHVYIQEEFFEIEENNLFFSVSTKEVGLLGEKKRLVNVRNITSEKEVQKLKEVDKIKTNFIANISHELRTPLSAIKAYVETILNIPMSQEEIQEFLEVVYNQSLRLEELLNDLLDFSQLESHTMKIVKERVNIYDIISYSVNSLSKMAEDKSVKLKMKCEDIFINCDRRRIEQVIINLLTNAIKFSDPSKEEKYVEVSVNNSDEKVQIVVEDNGIGIPSDKLDKIFEKFYRVDNELTYSIPGTGLGLSIVKEIVELHGGKIEVESEIGKYTKFVVTLPKE